LNATDEDRVFKYNNRYLIYSIRKRPESKKLVFVFSGLDSVSSTCRMSYYGIREELDATVVHVMDHFGAHGSYFLAIAGDQQVRNVVISLIRHIQSELALTNAETYFVGTSKGGTTAILCSLMVGGGHIIAGEPQFRLGDFIYQSNWEQLEQFRSIAYTILGRVSTDDKGLLNQLVSDVLARFAYKWQGTMSILYGKRTGYFDAHILPLYNEAKIAGIEDRIALLEEDFQSHGDIVAPFLDYLKEKIGLIESEQPAI
jgi:hypothetical protein